MTHDDGAGRQRRYLDGLTLESYPDEAWKNKARNAIRQCDVMVVLIGQDTHDAPGVIVETDIGRGLNKPIIQVRP